MHWVAWFLGDRVEDRFVERQVAFRDSEVVFPTQAKIASRTRAASRKSIIAESQSSDRAVRLLFIGLEAVTGGRLSSRTFPRRKRWSSTARPRHGRPLERARNTIRRRVGCRGPLLTAGSAT